MSSTWIVTEVPDRPGKSRVVCEAESLGELLGQVEALASADCRARGAVIPIDFANPHQGPAFAAGDAPAVLQFRQPRRALATVGREEVRLAVERAARLEGVEIGLHSE